MSAVNPSLTEDYSRSLERAQEVLPEPQYEDIDKYSYVTRKGAREEYEKMSSVQIMPTTNHTINNYVHNPQYDYAAV